MNDPLKHFQLHGSTIQQYVSPGVFKFCQMPYPNHPKGCPNYNHKAGCPPKTQLLNTAHSETHWDTWRIFTYSFDLVPHITKMRKAHPEWSERQVYCCLYWQPRARKAFWEAVYNVGYLPTKVLWCPEAYGVNIMQLCRNHGTNFEWPPKTKTVLMAMLPE